MAIDLITGKKGSPHITPAQDAMWHKGMFGSDEDYVFNVYEKFQAEKRNNNTVRIHSGIGSLQGRFFCIGKNAYEDVTIDNGAQGMRRYDAICACIMQTEGLGLHTIELKVIKGTPSASNPIYPQIPDRDLDDGAAVAYMLLYYVLINETTLMTPFLKEYKLFDEAPYKRAIGFKELTSNVLTFAGLHRPLGVYPIKTMADDTDVPSADYQGAIGYIMMDIGHGTSKVVLISKTTGIEISNTYDTVLRQWRGWTTGQDTCGIEGSNAGDTTLGTTVKNILNGKCALSNAVCTDNYASVFEPNIANGTIKILQDGIYAITAGHYVTTGFTVNDIVHFVILNNGQITGQGEQVRRFANAAPYEKYCTTHIMPLSKNDVLGIGAYNQTGARGNAASSASVYLKITKL